MHHPAHSNSHANTHSQKLIDTDEALNILLSAAKITTHATHVGLDLALSRVLSEDIYATMNVPSFDNSAMDGYAIALKPEQIKQTGGLRFAVCGRIPAGTIGKPLRLGAAAQIFTGAPIPLGANTVIMQEDCELSEDGNHIEIYRPISLNENIRPTGNDIAKNSVVLRAGKLLKPQDIALIASLGIDKISVFNKLKVGVFFTGNELVAPGKSLNSGQIFNTNRYSLVAMLTQLNCEIVNLGTVQDTFDATCGALETLKTQCDLMITTGGVSVGEEDHVKASVEKLGKLSLWRIKMKPGKPLAFGAISNAAFIGLPGNPVSAMVVFWLFARPFIQKMQGISKYQNPSFLVQANFDWTKPKNRREFVRVQLDNSTLPAGAKLYPKQGSDVISSLVWADGLLEIPENITFSQGKILNFFPLNL